MKKMDVSFSVEKHNKKANLLLSGDWILQAHLEKRQTFLSCLEQADISELILNGQNILDWDSQLIAFLIKTIRICEKKSVPYNLEQFPKGVSSLLDLALFVPEKKAEISVKLKPDFLTSLGAFTLKQWDKTQEVFSFFKQTARATFRFFKGKAVVRKIDLIAQFQEAGPNSFGIVSLICFLVGLILAFVGSLQLKMFGAQIYVSSLVAIAITRVMGAIMAGVIVAGRTGASYAATLGSMQVNEEIDALKTMGISPFDFLVLPRIFALSLMMPLLTVYADLMGILGGAFVGLFMLDLSCEEYFRMTLNALSMKNIVIGIIHGTSFGVIIALCGCYQGIKCGRNASAVGLATTSAVVYSIVFMTLATAFLTFLFSLVGF